MADRPYKRVLLKLSGEALMGDTDFGISTDVLNYVAGEVKQVIELGMEVGLVIGAGNIFRGVAGASKGMDRSTADNMGMLATVINSLAMQDALERNGIVTRVMSALSPARMMFRSRVTLILSVAAISMLKPTMNIF